MKKLLLAVVALALLSGVSIAYAAPQSNIFRNVYPETTQTYDNGTSTEAWLHVDAQQFCLTGGSCISQWPTGGTGSSATTTINGLSSGQLQLCRFRGYHFNYEPWDGYLYH